MYQIYIHSFHYITLGLETIFIAFSGFWVTVLGERPKSKACKRFYTTESKKEALRFIKNEEWLLCKVSTRYNIPWSTLKDYTKFFGRSDKNKYGENWKTICNAAPY